jgi:plastocyanin
MIWNSTRFWPESTLPIDQEDFQMRTLTIVAGLVLILAVASSPGLAGTISGTVDAKPAKFKQNAVVYIESIEGEFSPPEEPVLMDQKNLTFEPHVLPILVGTTVSFLNSDNVLHNVFSPDKCAEKFNLGSWPQGETREYTFSDTGCVAVMLCNVHPEMESFVLSLSNPYFAATDKEGAFTISDVPPGEYVLKVWHEKLKTDPQEVTVPEKDSIEVSFLLKR